MTHAITIGHGTNRTKDWRGLAEAALRVAVTALFAAFILGPLLVLALWSIAQQWFWPSLLPSSFTARWYEWALTVPNVFRSLRTSLLVAVLVTVATAVVAVPAAIAIGRYRFRGRDLLRTLFSLPLLVPYISLGIGIASVFYATRLNGSLAAVVLAHMIATFPFGVLIVAAAVEEMPPEVEEAALSCGAAPWTVFRKITLPQLVPALLAQAGYVFMLSMDEFTLTLLVSNPDTATLPVQIYSAIGEGYLQISSALAMLLLIPSVALAFVIARYMRADVVAAG
jgi:putative spermidine/putrescine transport system permease protein